MAGLGFTTLAAIVFPSFLPRAQTRLNRDAMQRAAHRARCREFCAGISPRRGQERKEESDG